MQLSTNGAAARPGPAPSVIRRGGGATPFDATKITVALTNAFLAVEDSGAAASRRIYDVVAGPTEEVVATLTQRAEADALHIEDIQGQVELALMRWGGHHKVARAYVLYRAERAAARAVPPAPAAATLSVTCADGIRAPLDEARLAAVIAEACEGLAAVSAAAVLAATTRHLYDGMAEAELAEAPVLAARTLVETEPDCTRVAARLVLDTLRREALTFVAGHAETATQADMATR